jgi:aminoglycoside phosphotransferase family enzyme/predicted kinase
MHDDGTSAEPLGGEIREVAGVDRAGWVEGGEVAVHPDAENWPSKVVETHISTLFFVGNRVYKVRKPVQFGFLDFRERAARRDDCEKEISLNRRLAPDVYLGMADLSMEGRILDHVVVMRRMPEDRQLATLADRGADLDPWLRRVAETLAAFHASAERSPAISADATATALRGVWQENFDETDRFVGSVLDDDDEMGIRILVDRWIEGRTPLLEARIASGRVCDGHGDLQAADIFCLDDGVRILDCVEFSDRLRHGDVCADVSFLAMDLERLGRSGAANRFLLDYQQLAGDPFPQTLVHHYCASRAYVRAKVACLRAEQGSDGSGKEARRLQKLALDHLRTARVRLLLVGGLPGCGKTTLAAGLGAATGWTVLRSDAIRRQTSSPATEPSPGGVPGYRAAGYGPAATVAVYEELLQQAEHRLGMGQSVILDASWTDRSRRDAARALADRTCSDLAEFRCETDSNLAADRIARRLEDNSDISEATPEIARAMSRSADPWPSATSIDTGALAPDEAVTRVLVTLSRAGNDIDRSTS